MGRPEELMGLLSNQELTRKELEQEMDLSNVSSYVSALINSGCVEEVEDGDKKFNLKLRLTNKGRGKLSKTMATMTIKGRVLSLCTTNGGTISVLELCKVMSLSQSSLFLELDELEENKRITRRNVGGIDYIRLSELGEIHICSTPECINVALPDSSYCKLCHTPAEGSISLRIPREGEEPDDEESEPDEPPVGLEDEELDDEEPEPEEPEEPEPEEPEVEEPEVEEPEVEEPEPEEPEAEEPEPEEPEPEEPEPEEPEAEESIKPPLGGEKSPPSLLQAIKDIQKLKEDILSGQQQRDGVCKLLGGLQVDINKLADNHKKEIISLEERINKLEEQVVELNETSTVADLGWYKKMIELALKRGKEDD